MSWIAPTGEDVTSELTPAEVTKFQTVLGGANSTDRIVPILDRVVSEIRGYIIAGGYLVDSDESLIPKGLVADSVAIARWRLVTTFPDLQPLQSDARKAAYDAAMKKLDKIANQDWTPELPGDTVTSANQSGNWNSENKIIMRTHPVPSPNSQFPEAGGYANS